MKSGVPKAAVIGYGFAGRCFHTYLIGLEPGLELRGVASRNPETRKRIETERGCRAYASFDEVIADPEVDLLVLATPNSTHAELAVRAMDAGKNVVTDKVMCTRLAECDAMIDASKRNGVLLSVFQNRRWDGDFLTLRKLLANDALGELRWLEMAWQGAGAWGGWRGVAAMGGGRFFDLGAHMLDQTLLVFPQPVTSVYYRRHHDYEGTDVESHAMLVIGFDGGATAVIDTGGMHTISKPHIQAFGRKAAFVKYGLDPQEAAMCAEQIDAAREPADLYGTFRDGKEERKVPTLPGRWRNYYATVAAQLAGRTPAQPPVRLDEARRVMAVFEAALQSARENQVVHPDIPALPEAS